MNKILNVAGKELRSYFHTWLGYCVASAALLLNGILFNAFALGDAPKFSSDVLRDFIYFASGIGVATCLVLSLRLIAEEKQNKSLVLLLASPISEREIIWGKFLAAFLLFTMINLLSLYLPCLILLEGKVSLAQIAVGYLGISLLGAAVLAISLFASATASTQLMAGILSVAITFILLLVWKLASKTEPPFRDLLNYAAIHNERFYGFTLGTLHLKDIVYYLSLIVFFTECAVRALEERRIKG